MLVAAGAVLVDRTARSSNGPNPRPDLQRTIDGLVTGRSRIAPGVTAFVSGPHGTWAGSSGLSNVTTGEQMRPDARLRLESVSKLWTATLILQLAGQRKLALDDTVARWLPGLLPYGNRITLRQLLNHTSGIVCTNDITKDPQRYLNEVENPALRAKIRSATAALSKEPGLEISPRLWVDYAAEIPLRTAPGTAYHYSNIGYMVAGLVAERVSGESLAALVREGISQPLGLVTAAYDPHSFITGPHAHGYSLGANGKVTDATTWTIGLGANGGIVSSAADEARFLTALMKGELLKPAQLTALKTPTAASGDYGLGTGVDPTGCAGIAYGHNGGGDGFESNVFVSGDGTRVAVLLLNGRPLDGHGDGVAFEAMRRLYCAA